MSYKVIKGKFVCLEKEFYGLFIVFYNENSSTVEDTVVAAGRSSFISTYSLDTNYEALINIINELLDDEEASFDMSKEIKSVISSFFNSFQTIPNLIELQSKIKDVLSKFLSAEVDVVINSEKRDSIQTFDIEASILKKKEEEKEKEFLDKYRIPPNTQVIDCFVVLSPIKGKPITEIKEGDLILCKIDDSNELGKSIALTYGLYTEDNKLRPSLGKVYRVFSEGGEVVVVISLKSDLMGIAREDEAVKVKYIEPEKIASKSKLVQKEKQKEEIRQKKEEEKKEQIKSETTLYITLVIFIILIAIIIMQIF
ncbi:MAG TPA: hypothetical protein PKW55_06665 [Spirochaetota bacterium]|nr:hypothetical protein [Spirochaetota bacterium]HOM39103.1 hypothetical protein [Spirochaetota bacterium]HPQ49596.1 hypothetical protein [Spirochaetota bacterium]